MDSRPPFFRPGGTMDPNAPSYIEREADAQLLAALLAGEYVFLLDSRQKGKSSMVARTIVKLREQGIATVKLDLQRIGANVTPEQWYAGMLSGIGQELNLTEALFEYWESHTAIGPLARWIGALQEVVLANVSERLIIFVDEIDFVRALPFSTDEFFAAIRDCYNRRSEVQGFERLTFCVVGVATPGQLIRNPEITPFNIGARIDLTDFTLRETEAFATALDAEGRSGKALIERVHYWVNGHPYLTQLLCGHVADDPSIASASGVDRIVKQLFFGPEARQREPNFADVERRMLDPDVPGLSAEERKSQVLDLYGRLLRNKGVEVSEENPVVASLRLAGIGHEERGKLRLRNRTYARVFDEGWRRQSLPGGELRRQRGAARLATLRTAAVAGLVLVALSTAGVGLWNLSSQRKVLIEQLQAKSTELERQNYGLNMQAIRYQMSAGGWAKVADIVEMTADSPHRGWEWGHAALLVDSESEAKANRNSRFETRPDGSVSIVESVRPSSAEDARLLAKNGSADDVARTPEYRRGNLRVWKDYIRSGYSIRDAESDQELVPAKRETEIFDVDRTRRRYLLGNYKTPEKAELRSLDGDRVIAVFATNGRFPDMKFLADGSILGTCLLSDRSAKFELRRWDASGKLISVTESQIPYSPAPYHLEISLDGSLFVVSGGPIAEVRRTSDFSLVYSLSIDSDAIAASAFSRDNKFIATGSNDGIVRLYDLQQKRLVRSFVDQSVIWSIAFMPDGKRFSAMDWAGNIKAYSIESRPPMETFPLTPRDVGGGHGPDGQLAVTPAAFLTRDGKTFVWKSRDDSILSRNLVTGTVSRRSVDKVEGVPMFTSIWGPLDSVFLGFQDGSVAKLNATSLKEELRTQVFPTGETRIWALSGGSRLLAFRLGAGEEGDNCAIIDARSLKVTSRFRYKDMPNTTAELEMGSSNEETSLVAIMVRGGNGVSLFSAASGKILREWKLDGAVRSMAISPDGTDVAISVTKTTESINGRIELFDTRTGKARGTIVTDRTFALTPSPTRRTLISRNNSGSVLWDLNTAKKIADLVLGTSMIHLVEWSPDGDRIITSGRLAKDATIWDGKTGAELMTLAYTPLVQYGAAGYYNLDVHRFSADGRDVVSVCTDGAVRIWHSLPWK